MRKSKQVLKEILPPFLIKFMKWILSGKSKSSYEYELMSGEWQSVLLDKKIKGWNAEGVLNAYKLRWPEFVNSIQSTNPFGNSPEATRAEQFDLVYHNTLLVFGYSLALASREKKKIRLLDWGGGIGHYYLLSKALVPGVEIEYNCKDVSVLADYGQMLFPEARFYEDESCLNKKYDFVVASSSLHYSEDWQAVFGKLAEATIGHLLVTRLPVVLDGNSYIFIQRPYKYGYNTEYLGWAVNRSEFLELASRYSMRLVREFITGEVLRIHKVSMLTEYRAFLFAPM